MEVLDDVVLLVDGKELKTNSILLAQNSPTFSKMITEARQNGKGYDSSAGNGKTPRCVGSDALRIEVPNQRYSDMKLLVQTIQNHDSMQQKLTGEKALKIAPLAKQFRMRKLKRVCEDAMIDFLRKNYENVSDKPVPNIDIFEYLIAADDCKLYTVKQTCVELLSQNYSASNRETIVKDKHLSDKIKTEILNIMCERMTNDYDKKLKAIRHEMEGRCEEIEKKREESMKVIQEWKDDLGREVDEVISETKKAHGKLKEDFVQKQIMDNITETIHSCVNSMNRYAEDLKSDLDEVVQQLVQKDIEEDRIPPEDFWEKVSHVHGKAFKGINSLPDIYAASIKNALFFCGIERFDTSVKESKKLQEQFESLSVDLAATMKRVYIAEASYQAEVIKHENTKVELMRFQKRDHKVNTWIKWAKPVTNSEDTCMCVRHFRRRQVKKS